MCIQISSSCVAATVEFVDDPFVVSFAAIFGGFRTFETSEEEQKANLDRAQALADLKFTYVVSCQIYGAQKKSNDIRDQSCYNNILKLMLV